MCARFLVSLVSLVDIGPQRTVRRAALMAAS
jgi:hypothetical protein